VRLGALTRARAAVGLGDPAIELRHGALVGARVPVLRGAGAIAGRGSPRHHRPLEDLRGDALAERRVRPRRRLVAAIGRFVTAVAGAVALRPDGVALQAGLVALGARIVALIGREVAPARGIVALVAGRVAPVADLIAPVADLIALVARAIAPVTDAVPASTGLVALLARLIALLGRRRVLPAAVWGWRIVWRQAAHWPSSVAGPATGLRPAALHLTRPA
jgi:hypothetical protein